MEVEGFLDLARSDRSASDAWVGLKAWSELVFLAEAEVTDYTPIRAVLWEVLWRLSAELTPDIWRREGPETAAKTGYRLNPFFDPRDTPRNEKYVSDLLEVDPQAAEMLAAAIRAERDSDWWNAELSLSGFARSWVRNHEIVDEVEQVSENGPTTSEGMSGARYRPEHFGDLRFESSWLLAPEPRPSEQLEEFGIRLTRLLLIGHPPTTNYVLPELLAMSATSDAPSALLQLKEMETALERLPTRDRVTVTARTLGTLWRGKLLQRERPMQITRILEASRHDTRRLARLGLVALAGATVAVTSSRKPPVKNRSS